MRAWPLARMKSPGAGLRHAVCSGLGAAWAMKHAHIAPVPATRSTCTLQLLGKCDEAGQVREAAEHSSAGIRNPQASPRAPEQQAHCCTNKYRTAWHRIAQEHGLHQVKSPKSQDMLECYVMQGFRTHKQGAPEHHDSDIARNQCGKYR